MVWSKPSCQKWLLGVPCQAKSLANYYFGSQFSLLAVLGAWFNYFGFKISYFGNLVGSFPGGSPDVRVWAKPSCQKILTSGSDVMLLWFGGATAAPHCQVVILKGQPCQSCLQQPKATWSRSQGLSRENQVMLRNLPSIRVMLRGAFHYIHCLPIELYPFIHAPLYNISLTPEHVETTPDYDEIYFMVFFWVLCQFSRM